MPEEHAEYNAYLLAQPRLISFAIAGILHSGNPAGFVINMRLEHGSLPQGHCEPLLILLGLAKDLADTTRRLLNSGRHPDHRPPALEEDAPFTITPDHPLALYAIHRPEAVMDDAITNLGKQHVLHCHVHEFGDIFVLEFVTQDGTTRPFCVASTVMHVLIDDLDAGLLSMRRARRH